MKYFPESQEYAPNRNDYDMNWKDIKNSILDDLKSRDLKQPNRRLNELNRIEKCLKNQFQEIYEDPNSLSNIDKEVFKSQYAAANSKSKLNGAEESLINEIYYRL